MTQQANNRIVKFGIIIGFLFSTIYVVALFYIIPSYSHNFTFEQRMVLAIQCCILPGMMFLLGILAVGQARFGNQSDDPTKCELLDHSMKVNARYLNNTHEQLTLFIITILGLAVFIPEAYLKLLPIYSSLFVIGRIAFWVGYKVNALYRAPGFGMCFYPAMVGMLYNTYSLLLKVLN